MKLRPFIGDPAMLEQTAEECVELAQACLKLARFMRGENKVYKSEEELYSDLAEEMADVCICMGEIESLNMPSGKTLDFSIQDFINAKYDRMDERIKENYVSLG